MLPYDVIIPPIKPISKASQGLQIAHIAVIETSPPSIPDVNAPTSNFPLYRFVNLYEYNTAQAPPPAEAFIVVTAARAANFHLPKRV